MSGAQELDFSLAAVKRRARESLEGVALLLVLMVVWEVGARYTGITHVILPSPSLIVTRFVQDIGLLTHHASATVFEIFVGYWAGVGFGFFSALLVYYIPFLNRALYPLLVAINQVPKISFAPVILVMFGAGLLTNTIITGLIIFFPMMINTLAGFSEVDDRMVELAHLYHTDELFILKSIRIPAASPLIMAAMKLSASLAVVGAVVAEFVAASNGLGFLIIEGSSRLDTTLVFVAIFYITGISIVLFAIVSLVERRVLFWYEEA